MCPWNPLQPDNRGHKENMGSVGDFNGSGLPCLNLFLSMHQPVLGKPFKPAAYAQAMRSKASSLVNSLPSPIGYSPTPGHRGIRIGMLRQNEPRSEKWS